MKKQICFFLAIFLASSFISVNSMANDSQWCMNKKSAEVWYTSSATLEIGSSPPWWSFGIGYESMICCVDGTDMDMCNYSNEDEECVRRVVRGICHPATI